MRWWRKIKHHHKHWAPRRYYWWWHGDTKCNKVELWKWQMALHSVNCLMKYTKHNCCRNRYFLNFPPSFNIRVNHFVRKLVTVLKVGIFHNFKFPSISNLSDWREYQVCWHYTICICFLYPNMFLKYHYHASCRPVVLWFYLARGIQELG